MKENLVAITFLILFFQGSMSFAIYRNRVVPTLEKIGNWENKRIISTRLWRIFLEYKKICIENGLSVWHANLVLTLFIEAPIFGILWIILEW